MPWFQLHVCPRQTMAWSDFVDQTPEASIALDGYVTGGPKYDVKTAHINFDHHDGVIREATMSTAMQVFMAIKGGVVPMLRQKGQPHVYINDTDQDTSLAVWLLDKYKQFEGTQTIPTINRLLTITDRLDITGGAFPMSLDEGLMEQHNWIFEPYTELRKTGQLARASEQVLKDNLDAVLKRLDMFMMGQAQRKPLDTRHEILYSNVDYSIVDEIGGNEARYYLFSKGMDAFVSLVARREDGRFVYTVGKRSQFIPFPVQDIYDALNKAEGLDRSNGWNGSDIVGGSSRMLGSGLSWEQIKQIVNQVICEQD